MLGNAQDGLSGQKLRMGVAMPWGGNVSFDTQDAKSRRLSHLLEQGAKLVESEMREPSVPSKKVERFTSAAKAACRRRG